MIKLIVNFTIKTSLGQPENRATILTFLCKEEINDRNIYHKLKEIHGDTYKILNIQKL